MVRQSPGTCPFTYFDNTDTPPAQFWAFSGQAGQAIEIRGIRQNPNLDTVLTLYPGLILRGTDYSLWQPFGGFDGVTFSRRTFVALADDEITCRGHSGDPDLKIILQFTGTLRSRSAGSERLPGWMPHTGVSVFVERGGIWFQSRRPSR